MAMLVCEGPCDVDLVAAALKDMPAYAWPVFLRIAPQMALTSTFKHLKQNLARDGFDPSEVSGSLYLLDPATHRYRPLTGELYRRIVDGNARL